MGCAVYKREKKTHLKEYNRYVNKSIKRHAIGQVYRKIGGISILIKPNNQGKKKQNRKSVVYYI